MAKTDENLVLDSQEAARGDTRAFDELVRRHQGKVLANCHYLTGSPDDAEDLAQGVFVKAYFGLRRFEGRSAFGTWIQRIKINHCLNHIRARNKASHVDLDEAEAVNHPHLQVGSKAESRVADRDRRERIGRILETMPESLRVPLVMRDLDGMGYQEIADELDIGLSAVKMRIKRGRESFRLAFDANEVSGADEETSKHTGAVP